MKKNEYLGEILSSIKEEEVMRFYFHNVNGGLKKNGWEKYEWALQQLNAKEVDVVCFAETNIPWTPQDIDTTRTKARKEFNGKTKIITSASDDPTVDGRQPGGTMSIIGGRHMGQVLDTKENINGLGRWSWLCLEGKRTNLYVATAYRVQQEDSNGTSTACTQHKKLLSQKGMDAPKPCQQWITDFTNQIKKWKEDREVLIMTDVNSPLGNKGIRMFLVETGMHNLIGQKYGIGQVNSHITGSKQIDFILGTEKIVEACVHRGILPFHALIVSDHRGMYVDINWKQLFIGETQAPANHPQRKVMSKQKKRSKKFKEEVSQRFKTQNIYKRSQELLSKAKHDQSEAITTEMNTLDDDITRITEEAEATLPEFPHYWWLDTLHHAYKVAEYWKAYVLFQHNGINDKYVLAERRKEIDPAVDIYQGDEKSKPTGQLRKAEKNVERCRNDSRKLREEYQQRKALEEATTNKKTEVAKIVKRMNHQEAMTRIYAIMKRYLKPVG
eukprot:7118272-Ditylum_brightwellii.AAC.2